MGIAVQSEPGLAGALFSRVQRRVLGLLFGHPDRSYQVAEVIRLAHSGSGAVQRELHRLAASGLVTVTPVGNQRHYRANRDSPVFAELEGLVRKTFGLAELREALEPLAGRIRAAFVYDSVAKGADSAESGVELLVITERLTYPDLFEALQAAEAVLQRQISPRLSTLMDWSRKRAAGNPFFVRMESEPKVFIIGSGSDLA